MLNSKYPGGSNSVKSTTKLVCLMMDTLITLLSMIPSSQKLEQFWKSISYMVVLFSSLTERVFVSMHWQCFAEIRIVSIYYKIKKNRLRN